MTQLIFAQLGSELGLLAQIYDVLIFVSWALFVAALIVVCSLSTHLLTLACMFLWNRRTGLARQAQLLSLPMPAERPHVLIQLPVFNEPEVVCRALDSAVALDWPRERLHIQLLDDSIDETTAIAEKKIAELVAAGHDVRLIKRENREGFKAGALKAGLEHDHSEFVAIFDADFIPPRDFLIRAIPALVHNPRFAYVQTRWEHLNRNANFLTRAQALMLDAHFAVEQAARNWSGLFMPFNGTGGLWRRAAIDDSGGWEGDTLTEDIDLSIRAAMRGWQTGYLPDIALPGELPETVPAWRQQQFRWTKGFTQVAMKLLPDVWRSSSLSTGQKFALSVQLVQGWAYPAGALALVAALSAMVLTSTQPWGIFFLGIFSTLYGALGVAAMVGCGQWGLKRRIDGQLATSFCVMVALNGGLTLANTRAVYEAIIRRPSAFVRTPKGRDAALDKARPVKGHSGIAELLLASVAIAVAIWDEAWYSPFYALTVVGLALVGAASLTAQLNRQS